MATDVGTAADAESGNRSKTFRRWLPVVQTLVYVTLMVWGLNERHRIVAADTRPDWLRSVQEGAVEFDPRHIDSPLPLGFQLGIAMNFPAGLVVLVLALPFSAWLNDLSSLRGDVLWSLAAGIFVPVLWYAVGRSIDEGLNPWLPLPSFLSPTFRQGVTAVVLLVSVPSFVFGTVVLMVFMANHETHDLPYLAGLVLWSGWVSLIAGRAALRWRSADRIDPSEVGR